MSLPPGILLAWTGTIATIPAGWARASALDGRFPKQVPLSTSAPGTQAGVSAHTHADSGHTHAGIDHNHPVPAGLPPDASNVVGGETTAGLSTASASVLGGFLSSPRGHDHVTTWVNATSVPASTTVGWASVITLPNYTDVIWIRSPGAWKLPQHSVGYLASGSVPGGMSELTSARGRYLRGALAGQNAGATGGSPTHAHPSLAAHVHAGDATHVHATATTVGDITPSYRFNITSVGIITGVQIGHTHPGEDTETPLGGGPTSDSTAAPPTGTVGAEPPFTGLLHVQVTGGAQFVPVGLIALYDGLVAGLGAGWRFCDGDNGTPDLTTQNFLKGVAVADVLSTGGTDAHTHPTAATHPHTQTTQHQHRPNLGATTAPTESADASLGDFLLQLSAPGHSHDQANPGNPTSPTPFGGSGTLGPTAQPSAAASGIVPPYTEVAVVQFAGASFAVSVTAPTVDEVIDNPTPTVSWTLAGGRTQAHYQVWVLDATETALLYTTGWQSGATASIAVPTGILQNHTGYVVVVDVDDTLGDYGESDLVPFSIVFTPSAAPTGLTVVQIGGNDPPLLPGAQLTWDAYSPVGGEVFQRWNIYRRLHGASDWALLRTISTVGTTTYTDYTVTGSLEYDYQLSYTILRWTVYAIESSADGPVSITITFTGAWLHVVVDPSLFVHFPSNADTVTPVQDQRVVPVWGRAAPTVHLGFQHWRKFSFTGIYTAFPNLAAWQSVFDLAGDAAATGHVLSLRYGNTGEQFYVVLDLDGGSTARADQLFGSISSIALNEVFFDPSVV